MLPINFKNPPKNVDFINIFHFMILRLFSKCNITSSSILLAIAIRTRNAFHLPIKCIKATENNIHK